MTNDEFKIPKLHTDNYTSWSIRARAALVQKGCWEAIDPGYEALTDASDIKTNNKALTFLFLIVEDTYLDDIGECSRAKEAWGILEDMHSKFGLLHILQLLRDLFNTKMKKEEAMKDYLGRIMELHRKLKKSGHGFDDRELALIMLLGLPSSYEQLILNLEQNEEDITTQKVKTRLILEEKRKAKRREDKADTEEEDDESKALITRTKGKKPNVPTYVNRSNDAKVNPNKPQNKREETQKKTFRCFCCGKLGHIARNCRFINASKSDENVPKEGTKANMVTEVTSMMKHVALSLGTSELGDEYTWYLDSAASDHMTPKRKKLSDIKETSTSVTVASGDKMQVREKGTVTFDASEQNGGCCIKLEDVLHVPNLDGNLLSMGRIEEKGFRIDVRDGKARVIDKDDIVILTAFRTGRLYKVIEARKLVKMTTAQETDLWHRRLGHVHTKAIEGVGVSNESMNENEVTKSIHTDSKCEVCMKGKMKKKPFKSEGTTKAKEVLELVHADVVGPMKPTSKGGSKYFVVFTDDYSHYVHVYFMKKKSEVYEKLVEFKESAENTCGKKLKILRSDNGGEFKNEKMDNYLIQHGIMRQLTIPRTPQQNGVSERMNQTLMDMARCILIESGVPRAFWADSIKTSCYLRNKCPSKAVGGLIPEEIWTGKPSKVDHLKVFGCRVWCATEESRRQSKLDPKGIECVLIGYPDNTKGYKVWDALNDKVFLTRDTIFEENCFPMKKEGMQEVKSKSIEDTGTWTVDFSDDDDRGGNEHCKSVNYEEGTVIVNGELRKQGEIHLFESNEENFDVDRTQLPLDDVKGVPKR